MPGHEPPVLLRVEDDVGYLTLNRPNVGNAVDVALAESLSEACESVAANPTVRCVVLGGIGRYFCVGGDIASLGEDGKLERIVRSLNRALIQLARMNKPLIVAVNGPAAGAGLGLVLLGDLAIAATTAHFSMGYSAIGLTPDGGVSALLPRMIGLRKAQELALTNRRVAIDEAVAIGLVTRAVLPDQLQADVGSTAKTLARGAIGALSSARCLFLSGYELSLADQLNLEASTICAAAEDREGREGLAAFLARRNPDFIGMGSSPPPALA